MSRIIPDPVIPSPEMPTRADVVIIGGGIVGVSTALFLAEQGVDVVLCEKGLIGAEQSARNWGWVRQMGRDPAELPLAIESLDLWKGMNARIGEETGFRQTGIAYLCRTPKQVAEYEAWLVHARSFGIDSKLLRGADLAAHLPGISGEFTAALHTASDGRAEPFKAAPAIARGAIRAGAKILISCAVRGIERSGGQVSGVVTEHGPIACSSVVIAGGAWSRLFAGNEGIDFPQLMILGSVARIVGVDGVTDMPTGGDNFSFRRRLDGGFTVAMRNANIAPITPDSFRLFFDYLPTLVKSWRELKLRVNGRFIEDLRVPRKWAADDMTVFEKIRILDPSPHQRFNIEGLRHLAQAFPAFAGARMTHSWGGLIDATPDAVPVIGPVPAHPGLFMASGFSGHGFGIGPGAGRLMAEIVTGHTPCVDPALFRFDRFKRTRTAAAG